VLQQNGWSDALVAPTIAWLFCGAALLSSLLSNHNFVYVVLLRFQYLILVARYAVLLLNAEHAWGNCCLTTTDYGNASTKLAVDSTNFKTVIGGL